MAPVPSPGYIDRFRAALISEIKAEMGRRDMTNSSLAKLIGESKQYVGSRLGAGNPHTGKRVEINVADLFAIAGAMDLDATDLLGRAKAAAEEGDELAIKRAERAKDFGSDPSPTVPDEVTDEELRGLPSVAEPVRNDVEGDEEPLDP